MTGRPTRWLGWLCLATFAVGILLWVALALWPGAGSYLPRPFDAYADPTAWWPILAQAVLATLAVFVLRRPGSTTTVVVLVLVAVAGVLGVTSYWHCSTGQSAFWTPLAHTLGLFTGNLENPFTGEGACPAEVPLSLQAARLAALLVITVLAQRAFFVLFANQVARLRARMSKELVVVVGAPEESLDLLRELRSRTTAKQRILLLDDDGASRPLAVHVRAIHVTMDLASTKAITAVTVRKGVAAIAAVYLLAPDTAENLRRAETFRQALQGAQHPSEVPPRLVVRIDDPWLAEDWRRSHMQCHLVRALVNAGNCLGVSCPISQIVGREFLE